MKVAMVINVALSLAATATVCAQVLPSEPSGIKFNDGMIVPSVNPVWSSTNQSFTMSSRALDGSATLTITRARDCRLVVLEDTADKVVIGCRKELTK